MSTWWSIDRSGRVRWRPVVNAYYIETSRTNSNLKHTCSDCHGMFGEILWNWGVVNHKLEIETGRYAGIDRDLRFCGKCAKSIIGDEYHAFFECSNPNVSLQRTRFIPLYFRRNRSMFNFVKLLQSVHDIKIGRRVSSFAVNSHIV